MKYSYDLHIHSCLSPCGDNDMTPNNIVNMAILNELDFLAVTDHNSCQNLRAIKTLLEDSNVVLVYGMEVETQEETHIIVLFETLEQCLDMSKYVLENLPKIKNNEKIFGEQLVLNEKDEVVQKVDDLLSTATSLNVFDVFAKAKELGGIAYPAHIDKSSYSIISNLGFLPVDIDFTTLEISKNSDRIEFMANHPEYDKLNIVTSSDAHYLGDILYDKSFIDLNEKSAKALLYKLGNYKS